MGKSSGDRDESNILKMEMSDRFGSVNENFHVFPIIIIFVSLSIDFVDFSHFIVHCALRLHDSIIRIICRIIRMKLFR